MPSLYFAQGLPVIIVSAVSAIMYKALGVNNTDIAYYTSLLYLPWVIKPIWSPIVDVIGTQRQWILTTQLLIGGGLVAVALSLGRPEFFALSLSFFYVLAFASATHDIAADGFYMSALSERTQAGLVGFRSSFFRLSILAGQGGLVVLAGLLTDPASAADWLKDWGMAPIASLLPTEPLQPAAAWSRAMLAGAAIYLTLAAYHLISLPRPKAHRHLGDLIGQIVGTIATFFAISAIVKKPESGDSLEPDDTHEVAFYAKPGIVAAMAFLLLYRFAEAQLNTVGKLFLLDKADAGGLELSTTTVGWVYGFVGVILLLAGGILGGVLTAVGGLRRWLLPMAVAINVPNAVFLLLALYQPTEVLIIGLAVGVEQFGYGFGFTGYMVAMLHIARGEHETAHYAICTGFMAAGMMLPGMFAGKLQEWMGYEWFFVWVLLATIPSFFVTLIMRNHVKD